MQGGRKTRRKLKALEKGWNSRAFIADSRNNPRVRVSCGRPRMRRVLCTITATWRSYPGAAAVLLVLRGGLPVLVPVGAGRLDSQR